MRTRRHVRRGCEVGRRRSSGDRIALRGYAWLERYTPFGDRLVSRVLEKL